ncbi:MAG: cell surface protein SprA, partial [Rhodothermia bacterium]|nr:cell surface protein SprA [Rhodothermia bacterium]
AQLDPDFKQDLRLGINGTIGDKLRIDVNYDSQNQFDYQNQLKLHYTGYEDEIIQSIEAGNVFLQTPSTLIRGGQSLFGIKSQFQIGGVHLTTVMSQQEGQSNSLSIEGGAESSGFDLKPTDYDEGKHFFLGYYFRNRWNDALSDPPNIRVAHGFTRINEVEIWKFELTSPEDENVREIVSVVDLGESEELLTLADNFIRASADDLPRNERDRYTTTDISTLRDPDTPPNSFLRDQLGLTDNDFQTGRYRKLEPGRDYVLDPYLGFVSLTQRLQDNEALSIAYRYQAGTNVFQVGDFSTDGFGNDERLVQKMLRPNQPRQPNLNADPPFNPAAWYLELRNIYPLGGRGVNATDFELEIEFQPPGKTAQTKLPGVGEPQTVIQLLGLDRLNEDGAERPDNLFDYLPGFTIEAGRGLLIFPFLEPFGSRIDDLIDATVSSPEDQQQFKSIYVFDRLYTEKKQNARLDTQLDVYRISGSFRGATQEFYDLRAYAGLVPGSVRVTSAGAELRENVDFVVDYQSGTLTVTNPTFLSKDIDISYEQNSFFNLQKKTLLGARADYDLDERLALGATVMRLSQKSPIDKFRIGEEPISNTIWGVDGTLSIEPRWLTRLIDAIPLINTKEKSSISITGEFAQLRPGHTETAAFERSRRELRDDGDDFNSDELRGISYVDDFEGFENTFSLAQPGSWQLASPPDSIGIIDRVGVQTGPIADSLRTTWRGNFGWYRVNQAIISELSGTTTARPDAVRVVLIEEVFPNRDVSGEIDRSLPTLDLYFNPRERGPFNYTQNLRDFLNNPREAWGGMMQRLPEGFNDFSLKNIEFVEFVMQAYPENQANDAGPDARLFVDLGFITEDILPNERLNDEDGLSTQSIGESSVDEWGRVPVVTPDRVVKIDNDTRRTEDLGIDGLASYGGDYPEFATEQGRYTAFLNSLDRGETDPRYVAEVNRAEVDPSGDDYHFYGNSRYFDDPRFYPESVYPGGASFQQRMSRYFPGQELNSFEGQTELAENTSVKRGNSRFPDTEDINLNSTIDTDNSYFQYELPLSKAALDSLARPDQVDDFVVTEITDGETGRQTGWYQIRIPVSQFTRSVGTIQDFSKIESIRLWTTGHQVPITLRFATLELVGSQWQKSEQITLERELPSEEESRDTRLSISSVNNEENAGIYQSPLGTVVSLTRLASGGTQNAREQAMVLRAENLYPGRQRGIFKTYRQGLDFLKYSNVRMFAHMHGDLGDGRRLEDLPRDEGRSKSRLFVRLGANETNDYYEYEQPLTPSSELSRDPNVLWQTNQDFEGRNVDLNSVNIVLSALNQLKVTRDQRGVPTDSVFAVDAGEEAPPGTRIAIRGTPSLSRINTISIGIRNPADTSSTSSSDILTDVSIWINELRVAGYDEKVGWSALANASVQLADLGRIRANWQTQTDGFGSLSSTLGERDQRAIDNWSVTTELNADKPIPEKFGWRIPVSFQLQSNTSTPRFAPSRGDVRLREILAQIDDRADNGEISREEAELEKEEARLSAETHSRSRSFTARVSKSGSKSSILKYTLDGISASYTHTDSKARNPSLAFNDSWRWSNTLSYRLSVRRPRTVRPFWFLDGIPVLETLGQLQFNYLPQSLNTSATTTRNFTETQERPDILGVDDRSDIQLLVDNPVREKHSFSHSRNFSLQYNPFQFLNLSFDINTGLSLNAAGVDTLSSVVDTGTGEVLTSPDGRFTIDDWLDANPGADSALGVSVFQLDRLRAKEASSVFGTLITKGEGVRPERHGQRFSATFRPRLTTSKYLDWINIQDVVYSVQYDWQNGSISRNTGASVSNRVDIRTGISLRIQDLWRKFGFYRKLEEAQKKAEAEKQAEKRRREQEAAQRKRERELAKQREEEERLQARIEQEKAEAAGEVREEALPDSVIAEVPAELPGEDRPDETVETEDGGGGGPRIPLPDPIAILRRAALAVTGIRDFSITYTGSRGSRSTNVGDPATGDVNYGLFDALRGVGPSLGYRFGFVREVAPETRISDPSLQVTDVFDNSDQFQARTSLNPTRSLSINLTWSLNESESITRTYSQDDLLGIPPTSNRNGNNRSSVWAFGGSYLNLVEAQLETFRSDRTAAVNQGLPLDVLGDASQDGRVVLSNKSIVEDFKSAFTKSLGTISDQDIPFPLPGWNVNYTGLGNWPIVRSLVQSATVRHGYTADYSSDFRTNSLAAAVAPRDTSLIFAFVPGTAIRYTIPRTETGAVRINQRYQPFIGLDLNWKGRLQTNVAWNKSTSLSLSTSNFEVSESTTNELTFTANFQKVGMSIPFLPGKRLNNRVSLGLSVSRAKTLDQRFLLQKALTTAVSTEDTFRLEDALSGDLVSVITSHTRTSVSPQISYQFSNRVTANFTLRYEKLDSEISRQPSSTNMTGTFNVRVNITN